MDDNALKLMFATAYLLGNVSATLKEIRRKTFDEIYAENPLFKNIRRLSEEGISAIEDYLSDEK